MSRSTSEPRAAVSRRGFHRRAAASLAGGLSLGGFGSRRATASAFQETAASNEATIYIDMHTHLGQPWGKGQPITVDHMLRWMDEHRIDKVVVLPLISPEAWYYPISTDWVLRQTKPHRDRLLPFCDVDPRTNYLGGYRGMLDILKRYQDAGAVGFGEHKCAGPIDQPGNLDAFHAASELGFPILFHMDSIRNTDKPGLPGLEKVLRQTPNSNFIGHAQGWWASISGDLIESQMGGYPSGPVARGGAIDRLMEKYPNLYAEFSAGSGANSLRRDPKFGRQFLIRRADRLMFGTDYLAVGQNIPQFELFDQFDLPADVQAKIFRDNARSLLGLDS